MLPLKSQSDHVFIFKDPIELPCNHFHDAVIVHIAVGDLRGQVWTDMNTSETFLSSIKESLKITNMN